MKHYNMFFFLTRYCHTTNQSMFQYFFWFSLHVCGSNPETPPPSCRRQDSEGGRNRGPRTQCQSGSKGRCQSSEKRTCFFTSSKGLELIPYKWRDFARLIYVNFEALFRKLFCFDPYFNRSASSLTVRGGKMIFSCCSMSLSWISKARHLMRSIFCLKQNLR